MQSIRRELKEELGEPDRLVHGLKTDQHNDLHEFTECVKEISIKCTDNMVKFAGNVMEKSVNALYEKDCKPPCQFSVVVMGSLARGEATPYSDIEYMFLVQDSAQQNLEYFETLAVTTYFVIGNIGETKLSNFCIKELESWFEDCSKNGFRMDGISENAGNIPTGRAGFMNETQKYPFILTPTELGEEYKRRLGHPDPKQTVRGDLTAMMSHLKQIYHYPKLDECKDIDEIATTLLNEVADIIRGLEYPRERVVANADMLWDDIEQFNFKPDSTIRDGGCDKASSLQ